LTSWLRDRDIGVDHLLQPIADPCEALLPAGAGAAWTVSLDALADVAARHIATAPLPRRLATPRQRLGYLGGRLCAERGLQSLLGAPAAVGHDEQGAPRWPLRCTGSISHSAQDACALVAYCEASAGIGIDTEGIAAADVARDIALVCCTPHERARWLDAAPQPELVATLIFSAKECLYKALAPWLRRFVDFDEAETLGLDLRQRVLMMGARPGSPLSGLVELADVRFGVQGRRVVCALSLPAVLRPRLLLAAAR
jgi:4'-phosphopantetheinyl transferase EntD